MISILVVDDEALARDELKYLLEKHKDFQVVAECADALEALKSINNLKPDVIFLDIEMPRISGVELAGMLDKSAMPKIVFVTAYDEYAIEAFDSNAIDYVLKPISEERLEQTLQRIRSNHKQEQSINQIVPEALKFIPCYKGTQNYLMNCNEIEFANSNPVTGVHLMTKKEGEFHTMLALKVLEEKTSLTRCHRQYLVNDECIKVVERLENGLGRAHTYSGKIVPVSRRYMNKI